MYVAERYLLVFSACFGKPSFTNHFLMFFFFFTWFAKFHLILLSPPVDSVLDQPIRILSTPMATLDWFRQEHVTLHEPISICPKTFCQNIYFCPCTCHRPHCLHEERTFLMVELGESEWSFQAKNARA